MRVHRPRVLGPQQSFFRREPNFVPGARDYLGRAPFSDGNGFGISPLDVRESVRFITERGPPRIIEFWEKQVEELEKRASRLL